ncbi:MAG: ribonuclease R [Bacilli bacterium]|nr:ribonuclease R [Bacilli bacterium]
MEEKVLDIINSKNKALTYEEIASEFSEEELKDLTKVLVDLEKNLKIRVTNKGKYEKFNDRLKKIGIFAGNKKGFGFVIVDGAKQDYYISPENVNGAVDGDEVVIKITNESRREAVVSSINKRNMSSFIVGEFYVSDDKNFIKLDDDKLKIIVEIPSDKINGAVSGHKVIAKIDNKIEKSNYYLGEVIRILGHKDDPGVDILSIAAKHQINDVFPDEVIEELKSIPDVVSSDELSGRRDLTGEVIFTIDGDDTKDIDDAISVSKLSNGNYLLGVHIADVSHYVKYDTALYKEAFERGTSSYLANTVIPMIPHQLSNGICSLNPDVVRLTISCVMEVDGNGNVIDSDIFESYIKSRKQMTYKNVNKILEENTVPSGYEDFKDDLLLMKELADIVRKRKISKGYIEFDDTEPVIVTDDDGRATDILKRERGAGEKLIEDFMILANEAVASTISYMELPFIYRVHGTPDEDKIKQFLGLTSILGYKVNANVKNITPKTIQGMLNQLRDKKEFPVLSSMLLRSMKKAVYDSVNIGHFGLASKFYTHFTSPIRRFPDLTVHRLLRTYLFENKINNETVDYFSKELPLIADQSSLRERAAVDCEREVDDMKMAEYMEGHIGEVYKGMISTVTNYGMYVIINGLIEGMVRIEDLTGDYYLYDESTYSLVGKSSKKRYMLGNMIDVEVTSVVKEKGLINLKLFEGDKNGNKQQKGEVQLSNNR